MSLVNDMLRDLEKRNERQSQLPGQENTVKAAQPVADSPASQDQGRSARIALWAIGVSALLLTAWFLWQDQMVADNKGMAKAVPAKPVPQSVENPSKVVSKIVPVIAPKATPSIVSEQPVPEHLETQVTDINWIGKSDGGELIVSLSQLSDVQLISQQAQSIALALNNTKLGTAAPAIDSSIVKRLDLVRKDDRVILGLLAYQPSRFAFRIQHEPPALIVGVTSTIELSGEALGTSSLEKDNASLTASKPAEEKSSIDVNQQMKSSAGLRVNAEQMPVAKPLQPVVKVKKQLTENQKIKKAKTLLARGDTRGAVTLLRQQINGQGSSSLKSRQLLASVLLNTADYQGAESLLLESLRLHSQDPLLTKVLARTLLAKGDSASAVKLLIMNPPPLSKDSEYYELMASAYQQNSQQEQSASVYYQLLKFDSSQPRWWVGLGYALEQAGRFQEARTAYQNGLQIPAIDSQLKNYARQRSSALAGR